MGYAGVRRLCAGSRVGGSMSIKLLFFDGGFVPEAVCGGSGGGSGG